MFVRLNIPSWSGAELCAGFAGLFQPRRGKRFRDALVREISRSLPSGDILPRGSGRQGLAAAIGGLGLHRARVGVPAYVCPAVLTALEFAGAKVVAIDCAPGSFRFEPARLEARARTGDIDAVLAPNTYGLDQDYSFLSRLGVPVIEDAAYQAGVLAAGDWCGLRGDYGVWSFNFKALTGVGGGVLLRRAGSIPESTPGDGGEDAGRRAGELWRLLALWLRAVGRHHIPRCLPGGRRPSPAAGDAVRPHLREMGPAAMSELQAAVILQQWASRKRLQARQRENVLAIEARLAQVPGLRPLRGPGEPFPPHLYPVVVEGAEPRARVDRARAVLHACGVQTEYPYPIRLGDRATFPNCHDLADRLLLVPCHASLGEAQMERVCDGLSAAAREAVAA